MSKKNEIQINFVADKKLKDYLHKIVSEGAHGNTPTSVVQRLTWKAIEDLVDKGWIEKINNDKP